jgi:hypothetical protein
VCARPNAPQPVVAPVQVTVQSMPALTTAASPVMVAVMGYMLPIAIVAGGAGALNAIVVLPVIVTFALADFVESADETPSMVTEVVPAGGVGGAVYVVLPPLVVVVGLNEPQLAAGVHDQLMPRFELLLTTATTINVPPTAIVVGGAVVNETATGNGGPDELEPPQAESVIKAASAISDSRERQEFITGLLPAASHAPYAWLEADALEGHWRFAL